jgi:hypothetical protein
MYIKVNFNKDINKDKENISGMMDLSMLDNGNSLKWMEKENIITPMDIYFKEYLKMIFLFNQSSSE